MIKSENKKIGTVVSQDQLVAALSAKKPRKTQALSSRELADLVVAAAGEHKPSEPLLLNVAGLSTVADWFFIVGAENSRQMAAIADKILRRAKAGGVRPLGVEGLREGSMWALIDLGEVVVHLFKPDARKLYDLEALWAADHRRPELFESA